MIKPETPLERAVIRKPFLSFVQSFVDVGGTTPGSCGLDDDAVLENLDRAGLISLRERRPQNFGRRSYGAGYCIGRRYRLMFRGERSRAFVEAFHRELRARNIAHIMDLDDGIGRAAFNQDWRERGQAIREAALVALRSIESAA